MDISIKNNLWNLFFFFTSMIFSIPVHFIRKIYIERFIKSGLNCKWGLFVRFYGVSRISIGNNVVINRNVFLDGRIGLSIGDNVDIGEYVNIWSLEHDPHSNTHDCCGNEVIIGDHVWIAPRSTILPGVCIGRGAVIANGSIVTKNVPEKAIVAGVPAKIIGYRNNDLTYVLNK